jgi:uncharacterized protein involved in outer membrane biogenesis
LPSTADANLDRIPCLVPQANSPAVPPRHSQWAVLGGSLALLAIGLAAVVWFWNWNWFRPFLEARASAALGRPVSIERLAVDPGQVTEVTAYGVTVASPPGFTAGGADFVTIQRLRVTFEPAAWWRSGQLVLRTVDADQPTIDLQQTRGGEANWLKSGDSSVLAIGALSIENGAGHVHVVREESDVTMRIATQHTEHGDTLIIDGKGTHARQPITFHAVGGALLSLRDPNTPYPVDLELANGPTRISLKGHIQDPMALTGADLRLLLTGPDMALLLPLTGIATPPTPPYRIAGRLDFKNGHVTFADIAGHVGATDLNGELDVDPGGGRPVVNGNLWSHQVDLADLGGFIGAVPGRATTPGQTRDQVAEVKRAEANPKLLPTSPVSMPKVLAADVHLTYRGEKVIGENVPFDRVEARLDIDNGHIRVAPFRIVIGDGSLSGTVEMTPAGNEMDTDADIAATNVNIGRLLAAAGLGSGQGSIDGTAKVKGRGTSLATVLAHGDGGFRAVMPNGGNVNSLLVDLLGLELGPAFFAAIGIPNTEAISCAVADFTLQKGIFASRVLEVNTTEHVITGGARVDLAREVLRMTLRTDPKHFTIGKLATPVTISGSFKDPHFAPAPELAERTGAAVALGLLFPPAALLPTIQFGAGEGSPCAAPKPR